ncbi:adenylate kinase [Flexivirga endophytica]|uniref:Adenylate kinase n=1 Tax=Flexivirga endophytica TaxID=1849103 RepID=A0A916TIP4_9MICO|nr:adenylate kinase [Flexivirga endophytica]GGB46239.1 adenylate kinase [Flexivirga endophytica]GHB70023.1 adenylate kinase [Flexivirga endophytica]
MRLIILGPPGAGKGTQAERICGSRGIPHISTGDIFRDNIRRETPLGKQVTGILDAGGYVPDEITNQIVADRLAQDDARDGFLLDGYPRTVAQVEALDTLLAGWGHALDAVLELQVDEQELVTRLVKRAETSGRTDDTEDVIRERQRIYREETAPLVRIYSERHLVVPVDGVGELDEVSERISTALDGLPTA